MKNGGGKQGKLGRDEGAGGRRFDRSVALVEGGGGAKRGKVKRAGYEKGQKKKKCQETSGSVNGVYGKASWDMVSGDGNGLSGMVSLKREFREKKKKKAGGRSQCM